MQEDLEKGLMAEKKDELTNAYGHFRRAIHCADDEVRRAARAGLLRVHERDGAPDHLLTWVGWVVLSLAGLCGALLALSDPATSPLLRGAFASKASQLAAGVGLGMSGALSGVLILAAGRAVRLLEIMDLRQSAARASSEQLSQ